jgi:hypothetical protein
LIGFIREKKIIRTTNCQLNLFKTSRIISIQASTDRVFIVPLSNLNAHFRL